MDLVIGVVVLLLVFFIVWRFAVKLGQRRKRAAAEYEQGRAYKHLNFAEVYGAGTYRPIPRASRIIPPPPFTRHTDYGPVSDPSDAFWPGFNGGDSMPADPAPAPAERFDGFAGRSSGGAGGGASWDAPASTPDSPTSDSSSSSSDSSSSDSSSSDSSD